MDSSRWQKLIAYYRSCVSVENTAEAQFQASNDGKDFVHVVDEECISAGTSVLEFGDEHEPFRSFMQRARWDKASPTYFYGFPCRVEDQIIRPLFIFDVEEKQSQTGHAFVIQPTQPRINAAGLGFLRLEERRHAAEALGECWDENKSLSANVDVALREWEAILPNVDREALIRNPSGALFRAVDSVYTRGLEQELGRMAEDSSANEVCNLILDRNAEPVEENHLHSLEITPLNDEQRRAVKSAFVNPLTVVTGPPGTGKSQVVINIVANALLRGETVVGSMDPVVWHNIQGNTVRPPVGSAYNDAEAKAVVGLVQEIVRKTMDLPELHTSLAW